MRSQILFATTTVTPTTNVPVWKGTRKTGPQENSSTLQNVLRKLIPLQNVHEKLAPVHVPDLFHEEMFVRTEEDENKRPQVRLVWQNLEAKRSCSLIATFRSILPLPRYSFFLCGIGCLSQKWKFGSGFIAFAFSFVWVFFSCFIAFCEKKGDKSLSSTSNQNIATRLCRFVKR